MKIKARRLNFELCLLLMLAALLASGCKSQPENYKPAPPRVKTATVDRQSVPIYVDAIGQAISPVTIYIRPQVAGKLIKVYMQQGAFVKEGEVIYEIDPRPYIAILEEAKAQLLHDEALLAYAEAVVERYKKVVEEDFISLLTYEQYESTAAAARAQVELDKAAVYAAQINVDFCKITAPASGKISYYNVDVGNILAVDDPNQITVIRPHHPIDLLFSLPQQQFEMIRKVQGDSGRWPFTASLPESPERIFHGTTYFIDNQIDQNTGTILLKGRLPNEDSLLWPGEFVRVKVLYKMVKDALIVPPGAVMMGKDGPYVYQVDEEKIALAQNVAVLTKTDEYTAIASDKLHPGDTVIVEGQINVAPGIKVNAASNHSP